MGRVSQVRILAPNFCRFGLENVGLRPKKITKNGNFWYKFALKGYIPLSHFYKILPGGRSPKTAPHAKLYRCSFINVAVTAPKIAKNGNFW